MLDLETLGVNKTPVIISIGAVFFDLKTGEMGEEFYKEINPQSCIDEGFHIDYSTIDWWMYQEAFPKNLSKLDYSIKEGLGDLRRFISHTEAVRVWANGISFDISILKRYYEHFNFEIPWEFYNERDVRTLKNLNPIVSNRIEFKGSPHNPIDDAKFQIEYCHAVYKSLIKN